MKLRYKTDNAQLGIIYNHFVDKMKFYTIRGKREVERRKHCMA